MNNQRAALTITRRSRAARALTGDGVPVYADAEVQERRQA